MSERLRAGPVVDLRDFSADALSELPEPFFRNLNPPLARVTHLSLPDGCRSSLINRFLRCGAALTWVNAQQIVRLRAPLSLQNAPRLRLFVTDERIDRAWANPRNVPVLLQQAPAAQRLTISPGRPTQPAEHALTLRQALAHPDFALLLATLQERQWLRLELLGLLDHIEARYTQQTHAAACRHGIGLTPTAPAWPTVPSAQFGAAAPVRLDAPGGPALIGVEQASGWAGGRGVTGGPGGAGVPSVMQPSSSPGVRGTTAHLGAALSSGVSQALGMASGRGTADAPGAAATVRAPDPGHPSGVAALAGWTSLTAIAPMSGWMGLVGVPCLRHVPGFVEWPGLPDRPAPPPLPLPQPDAPLPSRDTPHRSSSPGRPASAVLTLSIAEASRLADGLRLVPWELLSRSGARIAQRVVAGLQPEHGPPTIRLEHLPSLRQLLDDQSAAGAMIRTNGALEPKTPQELRTLARLQLWAWPDDGLPYEDRDGSACHDGSTARAVFTLRMVWEHGRPFSEAALALASIGRYPPLELLMEMFPAEAPALRELFSRRPMPQLRSAPARPVACLPDPQWRGGAVPGPLPSAPPADLYRPGLSPPVLNRPGAAMTAGGAAMRPLPSAPVLSSGSGSESEPSADKGSVVARGPLLFSLLTQGNRLVRPTVPEADAPPEAPVAPRPVPIRRPWLTPDTPPQPVRPVPLRVPLPRPPGLPSAASLSTPPPLPTRGPVVSRWATVRDISSARILNGRPEERPSSSSSTSSGAPSTQDTDLDADSNADADVDTDSDFSATPARPGAARTRGWPR